ncbi:glycoside hydrolase family 18 protein [Bowmanella pacifica]|uniref:glycoside hydrolase family 18 protein n=1 Tax=Bowmanella pacifica TaxID=502051 RepID=UPI001664B4A0|nr:glycoside hydrolase family 18 protein [Bowmanella pacifica]
MRVINRIFSGLLVAVLLSGCVESDRRHSGADKPNSMSATAGTGKSRVVGYFPLWEPERGYRVKDIVTRGAADQLTHILLAFGGLADGQCVLDEIPASIEHHYSAQDSVDGMADSQDAKVKGVIGQLIKFKAMYPDVKLLWSIGGWTGSVGFIEAAKDVERFADSCHALLNDPRWAGLFDGIDIDWEYPNACGVECDKSGPDGYYHLIKAVRDRFGRDSLVTSAIGAPLSILSAADYAKAAPYLDFFMPMTYDYAGAWSPQGPTYPHSPLYPIAVAKGTTHEKNNADDSIAYMLAQGIPADKILLGIGFYGRGWAGIEQTEALATATGPAKGKKEAGGNAYHVLKTYCPATGTLGGTAYGLCNGEWWSYDTPQTILGKMDYVNQKGLGGAFFWQLSGDTEQGELLDAIVTGLGAK